jgi:oligopeptide transport system substrate-binding protein
MSVLFNNQMAPFNDAKVRKAFGLSIDRSYIAEKISVAAKPACAYIPPGIMDAGGYDNLDFRGCGKKYWSIDSNDYQKNCEEARKLLAEAGFPGGANFPQVEYLVYTTAEKSVVEALQMQWERELGVKVSITKREPKIVRSDIKEGKFAIAQLQLCAYLNDPAVFMLYRSKSDQNFAKYNNVYFDDNIDAIDLSIDNDIRVTMAHECEDMLMKDVAVSPVLYSRGISAMKEAFLGVYINNFGSPFFERVNLKKGCSA